MNYGEYLKKVMGKKKKALKYLERSKSIYKELGLEPMVEKVDALIKEE